MKEFTTILPAEWEEQDAVLLALPHKDTDWNYMLDDVLECYRNIISAISEVERVILVAPDILKAKQILTGISNITYIECPTNDTWARDFGPISLRCEDGTFSIVDFQFNGWGLKFASDKDNLITLNLYNKGLFKANRINELGFALEGGSIESDGKGTILTTKECMLSPNRNGNLSIEEIESHLKEVLCADRILWLSHGALEGDDTDGHVDTLVRICNESTVVYVKCDDKSDSHYKELKAMEQEVLALPFNAVALPMPRAIYDEDGLRLPATYANFLIMNKRVLVPIYGQENNDNKALDILRTIFTDREVIGIDCNALIRQHGSLHCVTMQLPKGILTN